MSYGIAFTSRAEDEFLALAPHLQTFVAARLAELGRSPTVLGRRSPSPPYPPGFMLYEFEYGPAAGERHHFAILFRYGQDEVTLHVIGIGHTDFGSSLE